MPRQPDTMKASGRELISQTQDIWQETRDKIPHQQRHELGQVLTEITSRLDYACQGKQPQTWSKYSTLGGSELASHAAKTVQKVSTLLPVESSQQLTLVITEMANRVRYAADGELQGTSGNGESGFDFERESKQKQTESVVFA